MSFSTLMKLATTMLVVLWVLRMIRYAHLEIGLRDILQVLLHFRDQLDHIHSVKIGN